ncbi:MAG: hypothetical protein V3T03_07405, partial [Candidatus Bipolaricaulota bacterium]
IDPDCLIPVCEEVGRTQCPPCDGQDVPETTPRPTDCPKPIMLSWDFGEVPSGVMFSSSRSLPPNISSTLNSYPIVATVPIVHDVPADGDIVVETDVSMVVVFGTFEPGRTYTVVYEFLDPAQCPLVELTITVTGAGREPDDSGQTPYTPPEQPQTRACMTISAVYEEPGFLFFPATTTEISTAIVINGDSERMTPFQLCATSTMRFVLMAEDYAITPSQQEAPFSRWEKYDVFLESWEFYSESTQVVLPLEGDAAYRVVFSGESPITVVPRPPGQQVCLDVSAVFMYQQIGTTTAYMPSFVVEPISVQILVNGVPHTTSFRLCDNQGARFALEAESEHWTIQENRLEFWKWQRYNTATESWDDMSGAARGLNVSLQNGGQLRAVYRQAVGLY